MAEDLFAYEEPEAKRISKAVRNIEEWDGNPPRRGEFLDRETPQTIRATLKEILLPDTSASAWVSTIDANGDWRQTETEVPGKVHAVAGDLIYAVGSAVVCSWLHGKGYVVVNPDFSVDAIPVNRKPCKCGCCTEDTTTDCSQWTDTALDWWFNAELIPQCPDAGGSQKISHTTGCNWESSTGFDCGIGFTFEKWKLVISGDFVVLKLQTSVTLIKYRKRLDEFNPTCSNEMELDLTGGDIPGRHTDVGCNVSTSMPCTICLRPCIDLDVVDTSLCFPVTSVSAVYEFTLSGISTPAESECNGEWTVFNRLFTMEFVLDQPRLRWSDFTVLADPCGGGSTRIAASMRHTPERFDASTGSIAPVGNDCLRLRIGSVVEYGSEVTDAAWDGTGNIVFGHPIGLAATTADITAAGFPATITAVPRS